MTPWTARLLGANVTVFVLTGLLDPRLVPWLMLVPAEVLSRPWTAVTYMFVHGGLWHLAFNMIALLFFGPRLEGRLGGRHFLLLYFLSGLAAAVVSGIATPHVAIVGASGAVFGVLLGFARYWPRERILIWGIVPVEARWLVAGMTALALLGGFGGTRDGIAHFAHLGGFLGGWAYLRLADPRGGGSGWLASLRRRRGDHRSGGSRPRRGRAAPGRKDLRRWSQIDAEGLHEVNRQNLERIRGKIEREGPESLTSRERAFLDRLSGRAGD